MFLIIVLTILTYTIKFIYEFRKINLTKKMMSLGAL